MSDVAGALDPFKLGIIEDVTGPKGLVEGNIDIFIDAAAIRNSLSSR